MSFEWPKITFEQAPFVIIDGDRGVDYPKQHDFLAKGYCLFLNTGNVTTSGFNFSNCAFITKEKDKALRKGKLMREDIVLTTRGTVGNVGFYSTNILFENIRINSGMVVIRPDPTKLVPYFMYLFLRSDLFIEQTKFLRSGSAQPQLPIRDMKRVLMHIPPINEQINIVNILSSLDNRISLLRETNTTLEAIAQTLFKSWFVDFDPVKAKAEGRLPEGMDDVTAALFPSEFEKSALGLIPKGWRVGTLGDIAQTVKKQLQTSELNTDLLYVGLEHIPRQSLSLTNWDNAEGLGSAKSVFSKGDILFGKLRPYFHKVVIAPFDGVCSTDILICQPKHKAYYGLVAMYLYSSALVDYAARLSNGAKMPRINWKDLSDYPICIPPESLATEYSQVVIPLFERMVDGIHQSQTLTTLRDTLLPRLISGQLRLNQAQEIIDEEVA